MVVDLCPGSGSAGRACLRLGIQRASVCCTEAHAACLGHALDREPRELVVKLESSLFDVDLAEMAKTDLFGRARPVGAAEESAGSGAGGLRRLVSEYFVSTHVPKILLFKIVHYIFLQRG